MKFYENIAIFGALSCLVFTVSHYGNNQVVSETNFNLENNREILIEITEEQIEGSGELLEIEKRVEDLQNIKQVTKVNSTICKISIQFDAKIPWNQNFGAENSPETKALVKSIKRYIEELVAKVEIPKLIFAPAISSDLTHFKMEIMRQNEAEVDVQGCQSIGKTIITKFRLTKLLNHFNEAGQLETVMAEEDDLTSDFYFDRTAVADHVQFPAESPQIEAQETTTEFVYSPPLTLTESSIDYYYDLNKENLLVTSFTELTRDKFIVRIDLPLTLNVSDENQSELKRTFKRYVEDMYELYPVFSESHIFIDIINATSNSFGNETVFYFYLKTFNMEITDDDLNINNLTIFDDIFEYFDIDNFETLIKEKQQTVKSPNDEETQILFLFEELEITRETSNGENSIDAESKTIQNLQIALNHCRGNLKLSSLMSKEILLAIILITLA